MIQTICLHHLLQEAVATPYRNLVTRPTGAAVRSRIEAAIANSGCETAVLDFSGVDLLDFSCADEIVAKLLLAAALPVGELAGPVLVLGGVREEQREALDHVLRHHRLAVAARIHGTGAADLLGWVTMDARAAFAALRADCERDDDGDAPGACDALELAARLEWPAPRTDAALAELLDLRLACRDGDRFQSISLPPA
ncbi:MAG TPA: hypothetical protein VFW66_14035 [Gemmatimonadales bacterium]|nr:hypothetical protein [Gemmatimonadales bacterium]